MNQTLEAMAEALFKSWFVDFDPVIDKALAAGKDIPQELAEKAAARKSLGTARKNLPDEILKLFPDEFENSELGPIPKGRKTGHISDCCQKIQNGGTPKRSVPEYWESPDVPWINSREVRKPLISSTCNYISEAGFNNSSAKMIPEDATLVALYGATAGQVAYLGFGATTNQAICALTPKKNCRYYNYLLLRGTVQRFASLARGSAQQNISKQIVSSIPAPLVPANLLEYFDNQLHAIMTTSITNELEISTLAELRDTLLPKLISGELRVPAAEEVMEDAL